MNPTQIPPMRVALVDQRTGLMSREWYMFFSNLFNITGGGASATTIPELSARQWTVNNLVGMSALDGEPGEDGLTIVGPQGKRGIPGLTIPGMDGQDAEDAFAIGVSSGQFDPYGAAAAAQAASQPADADLTTWAGITPGANVATFLATPSSANLKAALTDETGSGKAVFDDAPSFTTGIGIGATAAGAGGIAFPATEVAVANVNTLDDYQEGTFTPTIVGSATTGAGTYTSQYGSYTKIGNRVLFSMYIAWSAHTGTGNMDIAGLPFTSSNTAGNYVSVSNWNENIALTAGSQLVSYVSVNSSVVALNQVPTGGGTASAVPLDTSGGIMVSGHYFV